MKKKDSIKNSNENFEFKKEVVLKDYDSLFTVYGRETNIVFSFRSWTITLLTGYYGFLLAMDFDFSRSILMLIPYFLIFAFLILEAAERSVMINLLKELRSLEKIFMETNRKNLESKIISYEFRDLRDKEIKLKVKTKNFFLAFKTPQILSWYPILAVLNFLIINLILSEKINP
ncbi:hypothetical protein [Roseimarinus sediminis]|uniref:hypothetical protein n=1 Tax=Roseimarinus sediminis TaxID=1610899 RepID=UPI003D1D321E